MIKIITHILLKGVVKASAWVKAKKERWREVGERCEVCHCKLKLHNAIGHHVVNRSDDGPNTKDNCQVRCAKCEYHCHAAQKDGNPPLDFIRQFTSGEKMIPRHKKTGPYLRSSLQGWQQTTATLA